MKTSLRILLVIVSCFSLIHGVSAQQLQESHKDSLDAMVAAYYKMNLKVFQANSTLDDIDSVFDLFSPDFTYVHPKYGGTYTREDLYNGYVRNQKNGAYDGEIYDVRIMNKIIGLNAVVVERKWLQKGEKGAEEGESGMTLFEFRNGKISRIFEYW